MTFPPKDIHKDLSDALVGLPCSRIEHPSDWYWQIVFGVQTNVSFGIECPWRLLLNGSIAFGDKDYAQRFGLPEPVDGPEKCLGILGSSKVASVLLRNGTSDVTINFENGASLELFNHSCGYEGWSCSFGNLRVIALGGGELAIMGRA
jgi:hypothetical protein